MVLGCFFPALSWGQIQLSNEKPIAGEEVTIQLEEPTNAVAIAYRPNSSVVRRDTLFSDTPTQSFQWIPVSAGVVALSTESYSRNVSVRFRGLSWQGLLVMLLAGAILFGGVFFAFRVLFSKKEITEEMEEEISVRPDT